MIRKQGDILINKKESFLESVLSLIFSQFVVKILGLTYSMYLINKEGFGDSGNSIYMGGYQIYVLLLTISSIGVPNAVAKLVSEREATKDYKGIDKVFKFALFIFSMIGFIGSIILFLFAKKIANNFLLIPECEYSLIALAPSIFFVAILSVIRGYFNGLNQISKTAKSQTIEQFFKAFFTIGLVQIISMYHENTVAMASVANFASTFAVLISLIYIFINCILFRKNQRNMEMLKTPIKSKEKNIKIIKDIFMVSMPITISAILCNLNKNIDSFTVVRILTPILGEASAKLRYGILSSKIDMLTVMPLSFNIALSTALVPEISSLIAKNDFASINKKIYFSLLLTTAISFPCALGLSLYSKEILLLLFPNASKGGDLLKVSAFCIIFMMFVQTIGGVLHGIGKTRITVIAMFVGVIIKLISNIMLIPIYNVYEKGAVIGNFLSNIVIFIIMWNALKQNIKLNFNIYSLILKPLFSSIIMILLSYCANFCLIKCGISEKISIIITIIVAIFIYVFLLLIFKVFSKNDVYFVLDKDK